MKKNSCQTINSPTIVTGRVVRMDVKPQGANIELLQQRPRPATKDPLAGQVGVSGGFAPFTMCYADRRNPAPSGPGVSRTQNANKPVKMAKAKDVYLDQRNPYKSVSGVNNLANCRVVRK